MTATEPASTPGLSVSREGGQLEIIWEWETGYTPLILMVALVVDVSVFTRWTQITQGPLYVALTMVGGVTALTYYAVACWFNHTRIVVTPETLTVRHRPLPWVGNRQLPVTDLKRVYTGHIVSTNDGTSASMIKFDVRVATKDSREVTLAGGFDIEEQPKRIEHEIETFLGLDPAGIVRRHAGRI